jgi:hypothetical protein
MLIASIILEAAVAILAILAARKGKPYVYGLVPGLRDPRNGV